MEKVMRKVISLFVSFVTIGFFLTASTHAAKADETIAITESINNAKLLICETHEHITLVLDAIEQNGLDQREKKSEEINKNNPDSLECIDTEVSFIIVKRYNKRSINVNGKSIIVTPVLVLFYVGNTENIGEMMSFGYSYTHGIVLTQEEFIKYIADRSSYPI